MTCFAVVAIVLLLVNTYFILSTRNIIWSSKRTFVESQVALIAAYIEDSFVSPLTVEDGERLALIISTLEVVDGTFIIISDTEGRIIFDPSRRSYAEGFPTDRFISTLQSNDVTRTGFFDGSFSSIAFTPAVSQGEIIGAICFNEEDTELGSLLLEMQGTIFNLSVVVAVISFILITLIILSVMNRVNSIINAVKSVREGEYNYTIGMRGNDELAVLSDEFNSLTGRLRETDEVRRRFVADASHELKTPLATIRLLTDSILQNRDIEPETVTEFISDINMEAERLARTTDKLMTLTKLDSHIDNELTRVNLKDSVGETVRMLKSFAVSKGVSIKTQLSDGCYIRATEDSVHHVIFNLIENAIKYNRQDGSVFVKLSIVDDDVVLAVKDRGIGVPDEDMPYIFDRFYRVDKARARGSTAGSSGLGLAIVKDTVRDLGGSVTAEKRKDGGMSFVVRFELYDGETGS